MRWLWDLLGPFGSLFGERPEAALLRGAVVGMFLWGVPLVACVILR